MGEPIDAVEVVLEALDRLSSDLLPGFQIHPKVREDLALPALLALFTAGGIEGDGDLVLRRSGDTVTVAGVLDLGVIGHKDDDRYPLYRIVEPS